MNALPLQLPSMKLPKAVASAAKVYETRLDDLRAARSEHDRTARVEAQQAVEADKAAAEGKAIPPATASVEHAARLSEAERRVAAYERLVAKSRRELEAAIVGAAGEWAEQAAKDRASAIGRARKALATFDDAVTEIVELDAAERWAGRISDNERVEPFRFMKYMPTGLKRQSGDAQSSKRLIEALAVGLDEIEHPTPRRMPSGALLDADMRAAKGVAVQ